MMRALLLCLLSALIGPLGRAAVQPADCDSSAQDLVPLDRENLNVNKVIEGTAVSVDGVLNAFHTSHHFVLQVCDAVFAVQYFHVADSIQHEMNCFEGMMCVFRSKSPHARTGVPGVCTFDSCRPSIAADAWEFSSGVIG